jgi:ATP-dependent Lon protease
MAKKKKSPQDIFNQFDTTNLDNIEIDVTSNIIDIPQIKNSLDDHTPKSSSDKNERPSDNDEHAIPSEIGILALRNALVFPGTVIPLAVGRPKSRQLLEALLPQQKQIGVLTQIDPAEDDPREDGLYQVGTIVSVLKMLKLPDGQNSLVVHGVTRFKVVEWLGFDQYIRARIEPLETTIKKSKALTALVNSVRQMAVQMIELTPNIPEEVNVVLNNIEDPGALADFLAANINISVHEKQEILEILEVKARLERLSIFLANQIELLALSDKIQNQVNQSIDKTQREYYLQEQLRVIQDELGHGDQKSSEIQDLRNMIADAAMPDETEEEALKELERLSRIPTMSPEFGVLRTYLEWLCDLPWSIASEDKLNLKQAMRILNQDHYDLQKVKKRIIEFLAVRKLNPNGRSPILCFAGPPGVGKTSLGKSIARAMGRKFSRISLGGVRDEADIRGHRRTYIGALPGRIIQELKKCGTRNPVFMLDEIDKIGQDFRGDPASALLEVLDPEQNNTFTDHYIEHAFDLSQVMFIATANYMGNVPHALQDRMEVIELPGYTTEDKLPICKKYIIPRQIIENGLTASTLKFKDDAILKVIESYTREAGVRNLDRKIAALCRSVAAEVAGGDRKSATITNSAVVKYLGPELISPEVALRTSTAGVATGLAYTPAGGEILFIEATKIPGSGRLILTGQLGDVMKESAQTALTVLKSLAVNKTKFRGKKSLLAMAAFLEDKDLFKKFDIHIHVPAGGIPKDGPSAGLAMCTAIASMLSDTPIRSDVAMTGEITLRGLALPIGGLKEKVLAAKCAGIKTIIIPEQNKKDLVDLSKSALRGLKFVTVRHIDKVLHTAFDA